MQTKRPARELLNSQLNVEQKNESKDDSGERELIKRTKVDRTPFEIITTEGRSFGAMGRFRIIDEMETEKEVLFELDNENINYNMILRMIELVVVTEVEYQLQQRIEQLGTLRERVVKAESEQKDEAE